MEVQVFVAERDRVLVCDLEGERLDEVLWLKCCPSKFIYIFVSYILGRE